MYDTLDSPVPAPRSDWPVVEEEDGVGRCRLCGIVAIIVGDQLCAPCKDEVRDAVKVPTFEVEVTWNPPRPNAYQTHTGGEMQGRWVEVYDGEDEYPTEEWLELRNHCPVCGQREPAGGSTCPGPPDPIVMKSQARRMDKAPVL